MGLLAVLTEVFVVVVTVVLVTAFSIVGPARLQATVRSIPSRVRAARRSLTMLVVVLVVNAVVRDVGIDLSWLIGIEVTSSIYAFEGEFVAWLQSFATPAATTVFGYVYIYGYVFLLVFPIVAYFSLDDSRYLQVTARAYVVNYAVGLVCYILFIAYGPRNYMPDMVNSLLYDAIPRFQYLTSEVNTNTNVFPSLHTSLSVTVGLLAVQTRDIYPRWTPIAVCLAAAVAFSTMYLGIHWATDVVAGVALGLGSVAVATRTSPAT